MTIIHNCPECGYTQASGPGEEVRCHACGQVFSSPDSPPSVAGLPVFLFCPICQTELKGAFLETVSCGQCRASYRLDEETIESLTPHVTTATVKEPRTCPRCGMANPPVATLCEGCGAGLGAAGLVPGDILDGMDDGVEEETEEEVAPAPSAPAPFPVLPPARAPAPGARPSAPPPSPPPAPAARPPVPRTASRTASWSPEPETPSAFGRMGFMGGLGAGAALAALVLIIVLLLALSSQSRRRRMESDRARVEKTKPVRIPGSICDRCDGWGFLDKYTPSERQCPDCKGTGHNP